MEIIEMDRTLFNSGRFNDIVLKYEDQVGNLQQWELYWLGRAYYKLENYEECINIYNVYLEKCNDNNALKTTALWAYYRSIDYYIEEKHRENILNIGLYILKNNDEENTLLNNVTCHKIIKYISKEKVNVDIELLYEWNNRLNVKALKKQSDITIINGKRKTIPSEFERYYSTKSKCELKLDFNEECIKTCDEALKNSCCKKFVYEEWFYFRKAKALKALEKFDEAIEILKPISVRSSNSYFKLLLGEILILKGEKKKGLIYYCDGLDRREPIDKKIRVIEGIGDLLLEKYPKMAKEHYFLSKTLKEKNNWPVSIELDEKINSIDISIEESNVEKNCKEQWRKIYRDTLEKDTGKIERLINDKAGIIKMYNGEVYFEKRDLINSNECRVGMNVSFNIIESYDKKKDRLSNKAINIKFIKE